MHVISKKALAAFWRLHPDAEQPLRDWFHLMEQNDFTEFASLRALFASADIVGKVTVFNIGGTKYGLIASGPSARRSPKSWRSGSTSMLTCSSRV